MEFTVVYRDGKDTKKEKSTEIKLPIEDTALTQLCLRYMRITAGLLLRHPRFTKALPPSFPAPALPSNTTFLPSFPSSVDVPALYEPLSPLSPYRQKLALLASFTAPFYGLEDTGRKKFPPVISSIISEAIRLPLKDAKTCANIVDAGHSFLRCARLFASLDGQADGKQFDDLRVQTGHAVRLLKEDWPLGLCLAWVLHEAHADQTHGEGVCSIASSSNNPVPAYRAWLESSRLTRCLNTKYLWCLMEGSVLKHCLGSAWQWKPVLNGGQVSKVTGLRGPALGKALNAMLNWQLTQCDKGDIGATPEEAAEWLREYGASL
jgi:hypothetical protein